MNMKAKILDLEGKKGGEMDLPSVFSEQIRPDIIKRAVDSLQANKMQPYGPKSDSGMRHAVEKTEKGQGRARVQRLTQYGNQAAESPNNVGGRRAHPPVPEKDRGKKMNEKEKTKARRSALSATTDKELVEGRGHEFEDDVDFPLVVEKGIEDIGKTKEAKDFLKKVGLYRDIKRAKEGKNIRAGKGKNRNRKYREGKSILVVLPEGCSGQRAFSNLPGVTVKTPETMTVEDLAPGGDMGRLCLFSVRAMNEMEGW